MNKKKIKKKPEYLTVDCGPEERVVMGEKKKKKHDRLKIMDGNPTSNYNSNFDPI